jgi:hypothetical protein
MADDALRATLAVVRALESLGVDYVIGGSLASSLHGIPRSTQDADLLVDLSPDRIEQLLRALGPAFYADEELARSAVDRKAAFNVIHLETMFKVDLFVLGDDPASRSEMQRRELHHLGDGERDTAFVATAEDTVVQKLIWYRLGNEVSDRQWQDLIGVIQVQWDRLDRDYLQQWATQLGLSGLLDEALADAGRDLPP